MTLASSIRWNVHDYLSLLVPGFRQSPKKHSISKCPMVLVKGIMSGSKQGHPGRQTTIVWPRKKGKEEAQVKEKRLWIKVQMFLNVRGHSSSHSGWGWKHCWQICFTQETVSCVKALYFVKGFVLNFVTWPPALLRSYLLWTTKLP